MRISKGKRWLTVVALGLGTVKGDVIFDASRFKGDYNESQAIFEINLIYGKQFTWTASQGVVVDEIILFANYTVPIGSVKFMGSTPTNINGPPFQIQTPTATPSVNPQDSEQPGGLTKREGINVSGIKNVTLQVDGNAVSIGPDFTPDLLERFNVGVPLYFEARWAGPREDYSESYSQLFTIVKDVTQYNQLVTEAPSRFSNQEPYNPPPSPIPSANGQIPDSTSGQPVGNSNISQKAPNGGGGLPSGAIIGIAVACGVVGLALVFGLVWYLLRRRQQKKAMLPVDSAYGSGNRAENLMAEKEAAADVEVSPNSPYSDEGASGAGPGGTYQRGAAHGGEALAAGAAGSPRQPQQDQPRSFTPYSDRPSASAAAAGTPSIRAASLAQTDEARVSVPSTTPGRATPRALHTPYAHLVEEGMTEEEIRRLEEEERQLDAAIEQAGRR
ncbi:uncharacterized protein B0T15DRAFT_70772 [Chaetomium strumarium]|uniref:Mid2 domain-containing protein n=1 Tax=Chaetomium strumarium TaxID=1170767 RepID=A0AAJ0M721_9PEZI|nr:hypothetical protein B0T15DRAFT_70772 [Chaetomium strumarium]